LRDLFQPPPEHRQELGQNEKREFSKALTLMNAYALLPHIVNTGVHLNAFNQSDKSAKPI